jgi:drug/metabolite transporter (DMT)-like permease
LLLYSRVSRSLKAHILLILVTFVWGATFVQIKNALQDITPLLFNAVRMTLAAAVLAVIYRRQIQAMRRPALKAGLLVGLFLALGYEFQTTGLNLTTPSKSGFLTGVSVVLVPVFLVLFWRRRVKAWTAVGVGSAFIGLYLLTVPAAAEQGWRGDFASVNLGDWLTLICAVSFAFQIILLGRATQKHPFEQIAFLQVATSAVLMFVFAPLMESPQVVWSSRVIWAIVVTGIVGTAVAFTIQAWAQQFLPPTNTALIFSLEPVFAWLTSYVVLGERLGGRAALGAALILGGVLVSEILGGTSEAQAAAG